jgi:hypothetical protein
MKKVNKKVVATLLEGPQKKSFEIQELILLLNNSYFLNLFNSFGTYQKYDRIN